MKTGTFPAIRGLMIMSCDKFIPPRFGGNDGITVVGLIAFIVFLVIVIIVGLWILAVGKRAAYEIAVKHDLSKFIEAEEDYYAMNNEYKGNVDDVISNDLEKPSTFSLGEFTPSEGVAITIISDDPFVVIAENNEGNAVFKYDFEVGVIDKR